MRITVQIRVFQRQSFKTFVISCTRKQKWSICCFVYYYYLQDITLSFSNYIVILYINPT